MFSTPVDQIQPNKYWTPKALENKFIAILILNQKEIINFLPFPIFFLFSSTIVSIVYISLLTLDVMHVTNFKIRIWLYRKTTHVRPSIYSFHPFIHMKSKTAHFIECVYVCMCVWCSHHTIHYGSTHLCQNMSELVWHVLPVIMSILDANNLTALGPCSNWHEILLLCTHNTIL